MRRALLKAAVSAAALFTSQAASADTVTDWWDVANRYFYASQFSGEPRTPDLERATTRTALAMFEAVNAIDRRYESYLGFPPTQGEASQDAAATAAAFGVLLHSYPRNRVALEESYTLAMAAIPEGPAREVGRLIGERAAEAALAAGGIDPDIVQPPYRPRTEPGVWIGANPPNFAPYWYAMKPWVMPSPEALRPPPPPSLDSEVYARDYEEIRRMGGSDSTERTEVETLLASYRQVFDISPAVRLATDAPGRRQVDNARLLALLQMAYDDGLQANALAKLHYDFWRPITAIRNGDQDGNPDTIRDPEWTPLLGTPNFPEYPCAHCTNAASLAEVMKLESGLDPALGVRSLARGHPDSISQQVSDWDQWVSEVSDARMYGGVHYRFSNDAGEEIGRRAARMAVERVLRPLSTD